MKGYRADIDGLRAVAIIAVVGFHAAPRLLAGGFVGVDIFFVISGYLISSIIFQALDRGAFTFAGFYSRRIRRIFPALIVVLAGVLAAGWLLLLAPEFERLGKSAVAACTFVANFIFWAQNGYFDQDSTTKPLLHLWSLGIEEQFYIFWPMALWLTWRRRSTALWIAAVTAAVSFAINIYLVRGDIASAFYLPQARAWELMMGAVLAHVSLYHADLLPKPAWGRNGFSVLGFGLIIAAVLLTKQEAFPGWWALLPVMGAVLVIAAGAAAVLNRVILGNRVMVWFGLISYPLYLWHWPLLSFARIEFGEQPSPAWRIGLVALAVLLAWVTYLLVEKPIRFGVVAKKSVPALCVAMLGIVLGASVVASSHGFPARDSQVNADATELEWSWYFQLIGKTTADCLPKGIRDISHKDGGGTIRCRQTVAGDANPTAALIGDSHAEHLFWGLVQTMPRGRNFVYYTWSCLPFLGLKRLGGTECDDMDTALRYIIAKRSIHTVILADNWTARAFEGDFRLGRNPGSRDPEQIFSDAMRVTLQQLTLAGKTIVFVEDTPMLGFDPFRCVRPIISRWASACDLSKLALDKQRAPYQAAAKRVLAAFPNVRVVDPAAVLCSRGVCFSRLDHKLLYHDDGHHLSTFGSLFLAKTLLARRIF